jgi:hypothetical protein
MFAWFTALAIIHKFDYTLDTFIVDDVAESTLIAAF